MVSLFATYPQLIMRSKNNALINLINILAPLMIFARRHDQDNTFFHTDQHSFQRDIENLRGRFMKNNIEKQKVRLLEQLTNNTITVDGIPHIDIEKSGSRKNEIMAIENGFRSLLGMNGVVYTYKRGYQWRTWRQIDHKGNKTIVCYKCNSVGNTTCNNCLGYWVIEEAPPPCPFEIMSIPNDTELCVVKYTEYTDLQSVCPSLYNINNLLITCNNPIETEWKITSDYNENSVSTLDIFCGGQESCQIFTLYTILPDSIIFKIINAANHIIYSRVMKRGDKNYACVQNCGMFDRETKTVIQHEKPLIVNLLRSLPLKNKRDNNIIATVKTSSLTNLKSNLYNLNMLENNLPHSRTIRTTQMERYNPKTTYERAKLTPIHITRLAQSTAKPYLQYTTTPFSHFVKVVHYKNLLRNVGSDRKDKIIIIDDSIFNKVELVTKTVCKKLEDKYKENDISETIED